MIEAGMQVTAFADDLTGANETAACFVDTGLAASVHLIGVRNTETEAVGCVRPPHSAEALVFDTETRNMPSEAVGGRLRPALQYARPGSGSLVYKKIDSTLRGPFAAEIAFLMHELKRDRCLLAAAFPAQGRTTRDGYQLVHGAKVGETAAAQDPAFLVRDSHLPGHLERRLGKPVRTIGLPQVEQGAQALGRSLERAFEDAAVLVVDAVRDEHLETLGKALSWVSPRPLLAGTAALARHLGRQGAGAAKPRSPAPTRSGGLAANGVLLACGSRHPATAEQVAALRQAVDVAVFRLDPALVRAVADGGGAQALASLAEAAARDLQQRNVVLLPPEDGGLGVSIVASALGRTVAEVGRRIVPAGLVLTGGDTAFSAFHALGVRDIEIKGEVVEGIPFGALPEPILNALPFITKAGGFGTADALLRCVAHLRPPDRGEATAPTGTASSAGAVESS